MLEESIIEFDAVRAVGYDAKRKNDGGNHLAHTPTSFGVAIKWILGLKRMSFSTFAKLFNNTTAQNANHLINRSQVSWLSEGDILRVCKILRVERDYFLALCDKIDEIRGAQDSGSSSD